MHNYRYEVIDAHCDVLLSVMGANDIAGVHEPLDFLVRNEGAPMDLPKLLEGGLRCQFMALFTDSAQLHRAKDYSDEMIQAFYDICGRSEGALFPLHKSADLDNAKQGERIACLLSIEGAEALEGSLDNLDYFFNRGVRALGITWNRRNPFGRGVRAEGDDGLNHLGLELVERMEALRMIVDASHLSDQAFWDLADCARKPFVASHSNARVLNNCPRNLSDAQIRRIAESGGVVGAVFVPDFIAINPSKSYLEHFLDHLEHLIAIGGVDAVGLGSDFCGFSDKQGRVIADASEFPLLAQALEQRGYGEEAVKKIFAGNWERLIREILP